MLKAVATMQAEALKSSTWVGDTFADDARAMHYGEKDAAGSWSQSSSPHSGGSTPCPVGFARYLQRPRPKALMLQSEVMSIHQKAVGSPYRRGHALTRSEARRCKITITTLRRTVLATPWPAFPSRLLSSGRTAHLNVLRGLPAAPGCQRLDPEGRFQQDHL